MVIEFKIPARISVLAVNEIIAFCREFLQIYATIKSTGAYYVLYLHIRIKVELLYQIMVKAQDIRDTVLGGCLATMKDGCLV